MTLTTPTREQALRIVQAVPKSGALEAGVLSPMAGTRPMRLESLAAIERFLVHTDAQTVLDQGTRGSVNHVEPASLSTWIREVLGDEDLSDALNEVIATRRAYGFLVPEIKTLIAERLAQCELAMK